MGSYRGALSGVRPDDLAAHVDPRRGRAQPASTPSGSPTSTSAPPTRRARTTATWRGWRRCSPACRQRSRRDRQPPLRLRPGGDQRRRPRGQARRGRLLPGRRGRVDEPGAVGGREARARPPRGPQTMHDTTLGWRMINPRMAELGVSTESMGETGENVAERYGISREDQDAFALRSHQRAVAAAEAGTGRGDRPDRGAEGPRDRHRRGRRGAPARRLAEKLAKLRPVFREGGTVTAGNASTLNDGAACLLIASEAGAKAPRRRAAGPDRLLRRRRRRPRLHGDRPGRGGPPRPRRRRPLARADRPGRAQRGLRLPGPRLRPRAGIDEERLNVNGGAIALGHPLGCSGARLATTLVRELRRRGGRYGIATMCVGVGQGLATVFENRPERARVGERPSEAQREESLAVPGHCRRNRRSGRRRRRRSLRSGPASPGVYRACRAPISPSLAAGSGPAHAPRYGER